MNPFCIVVIGYGVWLLWLIAPLPASWSAPPLELQPASRVQMVQHQPGEPRPFFRMDLNIVDAHGLPSSIPWQKEMAKLNESIDIKILEDNRTVHPFYVAMPDATVESVATGREVMLVFDVSGSMNKLMADGRLRFDAAKGAASRFLQNFQDGLDSIAIVPFESHQVVERIQAGRFVRTKAEARRQIEALPAPRSPYNTALYSATVAALEVLERRKAVNPSQQFLLIVLTDGKNDVRPLMGDDPGLLTGETGLDTVKEKANKVGIPIYTVGFGTSGTDFDTHTLRAMAWPSPANFSTALGAKQLGNTLRQVRRALVDRLRLTFHTHHTDWSTLKGLTFLVRLRLPDGRQLQSPELRWLCTTLTGCAPEGTLTPAEYKAWLDRPHRPPDRSFLVVVLRRLGILALFAGGLAVLWYLLPRLLWPQSQQPRHTGPMSTRVKQPSGPSMPGNTAPKTRLQALGLGGKRPAPRRRFEKTL
jgi:Mg-chelatase subunit ChlD